MGKCNEIQFNETSRKTVHECLYQKYKAYKIASIVAHHSSSVSREIFLHRKKIESKMNASKKCSTCLLFKTCRLKKVCGSFMCKGDCKYCKSSEACNSYKPIECNIQFRFPFVCYKDCPHYSYCGLDKYEYDPIVANNEAMVTRKASRIGLDMTEEQFKKMDDTLFNKVNDGQSINHICKNNKDVIRGKSSIYSYVSKQFLKIKAIDLPRAVTYKVRTKNPSQYEYKENKILIEVDIYIMTGWFIKRKTGLSFIGRWIFLGALMKANRRFSHWRVLNLNFY